MIFLGAPKKSLYYRFMMIKDDHMTAMSQLVTDLLWLDVLPFCQVSAQVPSAQRVGEPGHGTCPPSLCQVSSDEFACLTFFLRCNVSWLFQTVQDVLSLLIWDDWLDTVLSNFGHVLTFLKPNWLVACVFPPMFVLLCIVYVKCIQIPSCLSILNPVHSWKLPWFAMYVWDS